MYSENSRFRNFEDRVPRCGVTDGLAIVFLAWGRAEQFDVAQALPGQLRGNCVQIGSASGRNLAPGGAR